MATEHATPQGNGPTFVDDGKSLLSSVIDATEEGREAQRITNNLNMANLFAKAGIFADETDQYKAFAKIEIGAELGLKPAESMRAIYFGQNGPDIEIHTRVMLAIRSGKYKYDIVTLDHNRCEIQWYRKANGAWEALALLQVTIEQLKGIMVYENKQKISLADKWNYKSWREDMMYAYLQRRGVRRYAPETQGSYVPQPADEEVYEDAGITEGEPMTAARHAENVDEMCGTPTPDTAAQDAAKAAASPEAQAQTERQGLLLDIMHLREQFKIGTGAIHAWAEQSEARTPWGFTQGIGKAPLATLHAMQTHLQTYGAQSCAVLLGDVPATNDTDPDDAAWKAEAQGEQPALPGVPGVPAKVSEDH